MLCTWEVGVQMGRIIKNAQSLLSRSYGLVVEIAKNLTFN